ncbi:MAG: hypothetical protein R3281_16730 [Balneolaceae bacterium]|nr:hypothetical protein [Balneolaceae bacterium]
MAIHRLSAVALLILILSACSPEPIFRLKPAPGPSSFHKGIEYITLKNGPATVTMAYQGHTEELFAMDIEVLNEGNRPLRVDPAAFYYTAYKKSDSEGLHDKITSRRALDPEVELLKIDRTISRYRASRKTENALFLTLAGLVTVAEIASALDDADEHRENHVDLEFHYSDFGVPASDYDYESRELERERESWEMKALRITDLQPEERIRGLVFFPHEPKAAGYKFELPVGEHPVEAGYIQQKFQP